MNKISFASSYGNNHIKLQDPDNVGDIRPYQIEIEKRREKDMAVLMKSVNDLRTDLETLKSEVLCLKEIQNIDYLKKKLLGMEAKISDLKEAIKQENEPDTNVNIASMARHPPNLKNALFRLITLPKSEITLLKEMQFTEKRIVEWGKSISSKLFNTNKPSNFNTKRTDNDDATNEFHKFVSCFGGHCGGWQEQDHLLFLRERNKYKGKEKFLSVVQSLIPDLSYDEIAEHEKWYVKYEFFKNLQKEAIQKWKSEKARKQNDQKEEKEKIEEKPLKKVPVGYQQRDIAERIKEWKNRQLQIKLEMKKEQDAEKQKLKEEEKKRKELHRRKKSAVNEYKTQKLKLLEETAARQKIVQPAEGKTRNYFLLKSFRMEDAKFIEKKKMIRLQLESKTKEKTGKLKLSKSSLEAIIRRDPQRIFQPTFIWTRHCTQKREEISPVFDLNAIPRLAIPEWRRELE